MAQQGRATLKTYFNTGDKPTEAQFGHFADSYFNLVDDTSIANGIIQKTTSSSKTTDFTTTVPANSMFLFAAVRVNSGTPTIKIGTSAGGEQIAWEQTLSASTTFFFPNYFSALQTIYITLSGGNIDLVVLYLQEIF